MPLAALAVVELPLVMHHCDVHSLLSLARCCKSTLAAADSDFSWRFAPKLRVLAPLPGILDPLSTAGSLVARRCAVQLVAGERGAPLGMAGALWAHLSALSRVHTLVISSEQVE